MKDQKKQKNKFLKYEDYEIYKENLISAKITFSEHITSKRRYIVTGGGRRVYEVIGEQETILSNAEMLLVAQVGNEAKAALKKGIIAPFNKNKSNYMSYNSNILEGVVYDDVYQIDLNAAYVTAAKNRGFISEKTYNKFFIEDVGENSYFNKKNNPEYISGGKVLFYSKKCRLISLGVLAQKKKIVKYEYSPIYDIVENKKGHSRLSYEKTQFTRTETDKYNEKEANIFFTCAYDVDNLLQKLMSLDGVFFYWVDAVFVQKSALNEVCEIITKSGFGYKIKFHEFLFKQERKIYVHNSPTDFKEYPFPKSKRYDYQKYISDLERNFNKILEDYEQVIKEQNEESAKKAFSKHSGISTKKIDLFLEQSGYNIFDYILFIDLMNEFNVSSISDFNLSYLIDSLFERGINLKQFCRTCNLQVTQTNYKDIETIRKTVFFLAAYDKTEKYTEVFKESNFGEISEENMVSNVIPDFEILDISTQFLDIVEDSPTIESTIFKELSNDFNNLR